ncbi:MAG: bifunctional phosphopantothenoylcysteine decarboxylase/phosphopantothenate--cysteine ligase CoaBC [Saprospiraceae bacterium]
MKLEGRKIILGVCGSIAAYKSLILLRLLIKLGAEVKVILTKDAQNFVGKLSFSSLSNHPVLTDLVYDQEWKNHVELGAWADLILVAPITANTIAKFSVGLVDNLLTAVYLSAKCPVMIAPAMDLDMWAHSATEFNLRILKERGVELVPVGEGLLASGLVGLGRLSEPENILEYVEKYFHSKLDLIGKKILVTAGPTYEAIDPVRFIGNHSTGKMGIRIAEEAVQRGAEVFLILGPSSVEVANNSALHITKITSAREMLEAVLKLQKEMDFFILAAAVADFKPVQVSESKIKKSTATLELKLQPTDDIALHLGQSKLKNQKIVGFALETNEIKQNAEAKLSKKNMDMIVINSAREIGAGFGYDTNRIDILKRNGEYLSFELKSKKDLACDIIDEMLKL